MLNRITTMGKLLNNKQIVYNNLREQRNAILKQWKDLSFLDGINGDWEKNIAQLYESEASQLLKETQETNSELIVFYSRQVGVELENGNRRDAMHNLIMLIKIMNIEIIKKHCE